MPFGLHITSIKGRIDDFLYNKTQANNWGIFLQKKNYLEIFD